MSPFKLPSGTLKMRDSAEEGMYGIPVDENGYFEIGYRGTKYTNPRVQADGHKRSESIPRWTKVERLLKVSEQALKVTRKLQTSSPRARC